MCDRFLNLSLYSFDKLVKVAIEPEVEIDF